MKAANPYDEKKELLLISRGNEEAFTVFYNRYRSKIYGVALKMLKSTALAEDVVQEVFLKIWLRRKVLIHIERIEGYLFIIVLAPQIAGHNLKNKLGLIKFGNHDITTKKIYT